MKFPAEVLKQCWFLAGPTAAGKTAISLRLAGHLDAEILSLDSMAVYRGMDIGTAKAEHAERAAVPHHLIDLAEPHQEFSVAEYHDAALNVAREVLGRGRVPLFVGGTGLYLKAILRGLFDGPPADWRLRQQLEQQDAQELHDQLARVDPPTAKRLHVNDRRRVIRALEVHAGTGTRLSEQQTSVPCADEERPAAVVWLEPPRPWLRERIDRRVDRMMDRGLLQETARLLAKDPPPGRTARQALGYRELIAHLEDGLPLSEAVDLIKVRTRQFAKRQHTWFRNLEECHSITIDAETSVEKLADRLFREFGGM